MIFKLQRSILTTAKKQQLIVYNKDRSIFFQGPLGKTIGEFMDKDFKMFVHGDIDENGMLRIAKEARWQEW